MTFCSRLTTTLALEAIKQRKSVSEHVWAQKKGRKEWYQAFKVRVAKVERDYEFERISLNGNK